MTLKGILGFSLGNFLCLRGFASMGVLQDISSPPEDIQRVPKDERLREVGEYLRKGELVFFPEIILATSLSPDETENEPARLLFENVRSGRSFTNLKFEDYRISCKAQKTKSSRDIRLLDVLQTGTLEFSASNPGKLARLDGNHRLSATTEQRVRERLTPFCLILCQNRRDYRRFSRSLFHNINYKQVPLTMEHNLKLILGDTDLFPDDLLQKKEESFGWPYYLTRKLHGRLDFDLLPNLAGFFQTEPRTLFLRLFEFLIARNTLGENEHASKRLSVALGQVNGLLDAHPALKVSENPGLLIALAYFQLESRVPVIAFVRWVLANHLHEIAESNPADLVTIFEKIMLSRKRTIFVSMPFNKNGAENHFTAIEEVVADLNRKYPDFKPQLKVQRVDFLQSGTSFPIRAKIDEFMANCGLLIANLTYCNPNVYHEVGFMDGKARALNSEYANVLLFLDESVAAKDKKVGFNLSGSKQIRFKRTADFTKQLRENIERHYHFDQ